MEFDPETDRELMLLDEIRWQEAFDRSQDLLAAMAAEALMEFQEGKTIPLDPLP
jgi:hypothetical protein